MATHDGSGVPSSKLTSGSVTEKVTTRSRPVTMLNDDNFCVWKWNLKYTLKAINLYECLLNRNHGTATQRDEAMLEIISTLDDKIKIKVSHCQNPFDLFSAIEGLYTNKTSFQVTALHMKLSSFKFGSSSSIPEGISEIQNIVSKLKNLGENVSDHMVEGIVLAALPGSFRTFVTVWKGMPEGERNLSNLFNRIMAEVEDNKLFNSRDDTALLSRGRNFKSRSSNNFNRHNWQRKQTHNPHHGKNNRPNRSNFVNKVNQGSSSDNKPKSTCNYCKKPGHWISECRKLEAKRKAEGQSQQHAQQPKSKDSPKRIAYMARESCSSTWIVDSGATRHMTSQWHWFEKFESFKDPKKIYLADDKIIFATGIGSISTNVGEITNVYLVPELSANLFSIPAAAQNGIKIEIDAKSMIFSKDREVVLCAKLREDSYVLDIVVNDACQALSASLVDWHKRFGHVSNQVIETMAKNNIVSGLDLRKDGAQAEICEDCALNKGHAASHPTRLTLKTTVPGRCLHFDTVGPMRTQSVGGAYYYLLCKDEASGFRLTSFVTTKDLIKDEVTKIINDTELQANNKVSRICTDNGSEFVKLKDSA